MKNNNTNNNILNLNDNNLICAYYYINNNKERYELKVDINEEYINFPLKDLNNKLNYIYENKVKIATLINELKLNINNKSKIKVLLNIFDNIYKNNQISINKENDNNISIILINNFESNDKMQYKIFKNTISMNMNDKIYLLFNEINFLKYNKNSFFEEGIKNVNN